MNKVSNILIIILTVFSSLLIFYLKNIAILFVIFYLWIIIIQENRKFKLIEKAYNLI